MMIIFLLARINRLMDSIIPARLVAEALRRGKTIRRVVAH